MLGTSMVAVSCVEHPPFCGVLRAGNSAVRTIGTRSQPGGINVPCDHCGRTDARWITPATRARIHCTHEFLCEVCLDIAVDELEEMDLKLIGYLDYPPRQVV